MMCAMLGILVSCQNEEAVEPIKEVSFTIGLQLPQSGSMTRASASELYDDFYTNYIETGELIYEFYELKFSQNGVEVAIFNGMWDADVITLPQGTYQVTGTSAANSDYNTGSYYSTSLKFDETIEITETTTSIQLTAIYDCYLLFADTTKFKSVNYCSTTDGTGGVSLRKAGDILYMFVDAKHDAYKNKGTLAYETVNGDEGVVKLSKFSFENGKYYTFDYMNGTLLVPKMEQGN